MKKTLQFVFLSMLCSMTLFAQTGKSPAVVHTAEKSAIHVPPQETSPGLKTIYTNLGKPTDLYSDYWAWEVSGPNSVGGVTEFIAMPFTPKADSHVSQVQVAIQYAGTGANQVNLSIYGDSSGAPGTLLAGPVTVTNLPEAGTCCTLTVANFTPVAVTAGTRYWVVGDTPLTGTGSDLVGQWGWVTKDIGQWAEDNGGGWYQFPDDGLPAGKVLGTIP